MHSALTRAGPLEEPERGGRRPPKSHRCSTVLLHYRPFFLLPHHHHCLRYWRRLLPRRTHHSSSCGGLLRRSNEASAPAVSTRPPLPWRRAGEGRPSGPFGAGACADTTRPTPRPPPYPRTRSRSSSRRSSTRRQWAPDRRGPRAGSHRGAHRQKPASTPTTGSRGEGHSLLLLTRRGAMMRIGIAGRRPQGREGQGGRGPTPPRQVPKGWVVCHSGSNRSLDLSLEVFESCMRRWGGGRGRCIQR